MAPMISTKDEARDFTDKARSYGLATAGMMIEVPSAALMADKLFEHADFASIGTNDLTQYTLAVDRGNPAVAAYYQADSPAVLRLMELAARAIRKAKKKMSVCGESAAEPALAQRYIQMGIHTLSMASPAILALKEALIGEGE